MRNRLDSRSKTVHQRILIDLGVSRAAYDISRAAKGASGNNADALFVILNQEIAGFVGEDVGSRQHWTADQFQSAYDSLDDIGDEVAANVRKALEDRNASG